MESIKLFTPGKQGVTGSCLLKGEDTVFKFSDQLLHTGTHEYRVGRSLRPIANRTPWFVNVIKLECIPYDPGFISHELSKRLEEEVVKNDFEEDPVVTDMEKKHMRIDTCFFENVVDSYSLLEVIESKNVPDFVVTSIVRQIMYAIKSAHEKTGFTHYDMHSENVLVQSCSNRLWIVDRYNKKILPTWGFVPRIIDFGFSATNDTVEGPVTASFGFMDYGIVSHECNDTADLRLFFTSLEYDLLKNRRDAPITRLIQTTNARTFDLMDIDKTTGWYRQRKGTASDFIMESVESFSDEEETNMSTIILSNLQIVLSLIEILIIPPLYTSTKQPSQLKNTILRATKKLATCFKPIDDDCVSNVEGIYIFRIMCRAAEEVIVSGLPETEFRNQTFDEIKGLKPFYEPAVDWTKMFAALREFADVFKDVISSEWTFRKKLFDSDRKKLHESIGCEERQFMQAYTDMMDDLLRPEAADPTGRWDAVSTTPQVEDDDILVMDIDLESDSSVYVSSRNTTLNYNDFTSVKTRSAPSIEAEWCVDEEEEKDDFFLWV